MKNNIQEECNHCKDKCCDWKIAFPLFVTPEEKKKLRKINFSYPCPYFKNELCIIYGKRPLDCRLFPFDIIKYKNEMHWIVWKVNCSIANKNKRELEKYLQDNEKKIIPKFKQFMEEYNNYREKELLRDYEYRLLRAINI